MSASPERAPSSVSTAGFEDGLGRRAIRFDRQVGEMLECLYLRPELSAFEALVRSAAAGLAALDDERFARARSIERTPYGLVVVSDLVAGERLSDILDTRRAEEAGVSGLDAAIGLMLQVMPALATLHAAGITHGTLGPGRLMLTATSQVVLLDPLYAAAVERLRLSGRSLRAMLGIVTAPADGPAPIDRAADVAQIALAALALAIGRPISTADPDTLLPLVEEVAEIAQIRGDDRFAASLRAVFHSALPLPGERTRVSVEGLAADIRGLAHRIGEESALAALGDLVRYQPPLPERQPSAPTAPIRTSMPTVKAAAPTPPAKAAAPAPPVKGPAPAPPVKAAAPAPPAAVTVATPPQPVDVGPLAAVAPAYETPEIIEKAAAPEPRTVVEPPSAAPAIPPPAAFVHTPAVTTVEEPPAVIATSRTVVEPEPAAEHVPPPRAPEPPAVAAAAAPTLAAPEPPTLLAPVPPPVPAEAAAPAASAVPPAIPVDSWPPQAPWLSGTPVQPPPLAVEPPPVAYAAPPPAMAPPAPPFLAPPAGVVHGAVDPLPPLPAAPAAGTPMFEPPTYAAPRAVPPPVVHAPGPVFAPHPPAPVFAPPAPGPVFAQPTVFAPPASHPVFAPPAAQMPAPPAATPPSGAPLKIKVKSPAGYAPPRSTVTLPPAEMPPRAVPFVNRAGGERQGSRFPWKLTAAAVLVLVVGAAAGRDYLQGRPATAPAATKPAAPVPVKAPVAATAATLTIASQPAGARVTLDGEEVGVTPLSLDNVKPGRHLVTLATDTTTIRKTVRVEAGKSTVLDVPVYSGWIAVFAPIPLHVSEAGRSLGTTESGRILLSPGRHFLTFTNTELAYSVTQAVEVAAGEERAMNLTPKGPVNLNAQPWAEVWVDGVRAGETPLANLQVPLGTREFVFRHPQYGERKQVARITTVASAISVDFTKPPIRP